MRGLIPMIATADPAAGPDTPRSEMDVSSTMVLMTWLSFGVAAFILHRIAWKPMLRALERRETMIRKSLEDAEKSRKSVEHAADRQRQMLDEAHARSQAIVEDARKAAATLAATIETEARQEARRLVVEAAGEIENQRRKAIESIRGEAAELAADLAENILNNRAAGPEGAAFTARAVGNLETHGPA